jgi:hypothetical protein
MCAFEWIDKGSQIVMSVAGADLSYSTHFKHLEEVPLGVRVHF